MVKFPPSEARGRRYFQNYGWRWRNALFDLFELFYVPVDHATRQVPGFRAVVLSLFTGSNSMGKPVRLPIS